MTFKPEDLGFEICQFPPDTDPCECCNARMVQLYFRRTDVFSMDGQYYCLPCIEKENEANKTWEQEMEKSDKQEVS